MKKSFLKLTVLMLVLSLALAACGGGDKKTSKSSDGGNKSGSQDGGTLTYAMEAEFKGILDVNFYDSQSDSEILTFNTDPLITFDENIKAQPNIAKWETKDNKVFKFTFEKGVKWHNGDELVVDDWIFALETIASIGPDHQRWSNVNTIEGAKEFNEGKADSISGLKKLMTMKLKLLSTKLEQIT